MKAHLRMFGKELLLQNEYLVAGNCILRARLPVRLRLSDPERSTLAEIGRRLGRKGLQQVACVAKLETVLGRIGVHPGIRYWSSVPDS